jgi:hypothetical protein
VVLAVPHSESKITQSGVQMLVQKDILGFQVSMDDSSLVEIDQCVQNLPENLPFNRFLLAFRILLKKVHKVLAVTVLHLNVENFLSLRLIQSHAVNSGAFSYVA